MIVLDGLQSLIELCEFVLARCKLDFFFADSKTSSAHYAYGGKEKTNPVGSWYER